MIETVQKAFSHLENGQVAEALHLWQGLRSQKPIGAEAYNQRGLLAYHLKLYQESLTDFIQALQIREDPGYANNLCLAWTNLGDHDKALVLIDEILKRQPDDAVSLFNKAVILQNQNQLAEAKTYFESSYEKLGQDHAGALYALASVTDRLGDTEACETYLDKLLKIDPHHDQALALRATILRDQGQAEEAQKLVEQALTQTPQSTALLYELGHLYHRDEKYDKSIVCFVQANQLEQSPIDPLSFFIQETDELAQYYRGNPSPVSTTHFGSDALKRRPLFIVGSPRSGTTLLAQMLGCDDQIYNAGELEWMKAILIELGQELKTNNLAKITEHLWKQQNQTLRNQLSESYLKRFDRFEQTPEPRYVIDKLPANARRMGMIAALAPRAKIIQLIRDGREVAFSAFSTRFKDDIWHSHKPDWALVEWDAAIRLGRLGATAYGLDRLEVRYEDLINETEATLKNVFEFLELEFSPASLEFHKKVVPSNTASYRQVRRPLPKQVVQNCRHYPQLFEQLTELGKTRLTELGYLS